MPHFSVVHFGPFYMNDYWVPFNLKQFSNTLLKLTFIQVSYICNFFLHWIAMFSGKQSSHKNRFIWFLTEVHFDLLSLKYKSCFNCIPWSTLFWTKSFLEWEFVFSFSFFCSIHIEINYLVFLFHWFVSKLFVVIFHAEYMYCFS